MPRDGRPGTTGQGHAHSRAAHSFVWWEMDKPPLCGHTGLTRKLVQGPEDPSLNGAERSGVTQENNEAGQARVGHMGVVTSASLCPAGLGKTYTSSGPRPRRGPGFLQRLQP